MCVEEQGQHSLSQVSRIGEGRKGSQGQLSGEAGRLCRTSEPTVKSKTRKALQSFEQRSDMM